MTNLRVWAALSLLPLAGCSAADATDGDNSSSYGSGLLSSSTDGDEEAEREPFDESAASEKAEQEVADETYVGLGSSYGCTDDCSGHEAGFRWRADHGSQGFSADSPSFNEGGQAFDDAVEEKVEEIRTAHEDGEDPEE